MILKKYDLLHFTVLFICQRRYHSVAVVCQNYSTWEIRVNLAIIFTEIACFNARFIWFSFKIRHEFPSRPINPHQSTPCTWCQKHGFKGDAVLSRESQPFSEFLYTSNHTYALGVTMCEIRASNPIHLAIIEATLSWGSIKFESIAIADN